MFSSELCWHRGISKLWYSITLPLRTESSFFALSTEKGHVRSYRRSHLTPSPYVRTNPRSVRFSDFYDRRRLPLPSFLTLRLDIQSLWDVLSRFLGHELAKKLNFVGVKFHPVERPLPGIVTCSRPSSTWHSVHNSSSASAGAGRPRQKTFSFSFRERSKEFHNRAILAM